MPFCHVSLKVERISPLPYPDQLETLGDHLRTRRLDLGLLQREVAEQLGVTTGTVVNWELNRTSPDLRYIPHIITFLGYDPCNRESGTLGERIVAYRRKIGLSQKRLAHQLGIDPTTLARWERGESQPSPELRTRLAVFLDLDP